MYVGDIRIGSAAGKVINFMPGENVITVKAKVDLNAVSQSMRKIIDVELPYMRQGLVVTSGWGHSVVYNGVHLPYWESVLQRTELTISRPLMNLSHEVIDGLADSVKNTWLSAVLPGFLNNGLGKLAESAIDTLADMPEQQIHAAKIGLVFAGKRLLQLLKLSGYQP